MTEALKMVKSVMGEAEAEEVKYWLSDDRIFRYFLTGNLHAARRA